MSIRLSNYDYSYANNIGTKLQIPFARLCSLYKVVSELDRGDDCTKRIDKIAAKILCGIAVIVASPFMLLGKAMICCSKSKVNFSNIHQTPLPIKLPDGLLNDKSLDPKKLVARLSKFNTKSQYDNEIKLLSKLCEADKDPFIFSDNPAVREEFLGELTTDLKGLLKKMETGEISGDNEKAILLELADLPKHCFSTWHKYAHKLLARVSGREETVQVKLLRLVQDYKESTILEFVELDGQWHGLSSMALAYGKELGLNAGQAKLDAFKSWRRGDELTTAKMEFLLRYANANRLVFGVQNLIMTLEFDPDYHAFLVEKVKERGIKGEEAPDYVTNNFFDEDSNINFRGVNFMLKEIGILK